MSPDDFLNTMLDFFYGNLRFNKELFFKHSPNLKNKCFLCEKGGEIKLNNFLWVKHQKNDNEQIIKHKLWKE